MKAQPDQFVVLVATPWQTPDTSSFVEAFEEYWQEEVDIGLGRDSKSGTIVVDDIGIQLVVDEPLPELTSLAPTSLEPYGASDLALLQQHESIWRLVGPGGRKSAEAVLEIVGALVTAGASGAFLPGTRRLHSPRVVRRLTMDLDEQNLANFFVGAFDRDGWMRTRGLTPFGFPEIETPINRGMNAAYFGLMDVAAAMIAQGSPFTSGNRIQLGAQLCRLEDGPQGPEDDDVPVNGVHGVLSLLPI